MSCKNTGEVATVRGCIMNTCRLPKYLIGYKTDGCDGIRSVKNCSVSCDSGYSGKPCSAKHQEFF